MAISLKHSFVNLTLSQLTFMVSGYIVNIFLGKLLGPNNYGVYGIIVSLITVVNLTQTAGLPQAVAKFSAENEERSEEVLKSGLTIQFFSTSFASLIIFLFALPISQILKDASLTSYIQLSALIFPLYGIFSLYLNYYNGLHAFGKQSLMNVLYSITKLLTILILVYFFHIYGAIIGFIISSFIPLLFWFHIPRAVKNFPYKILVLFSLPLVVIAIFANLLQSIDLFFIKAITTSNNNVGFYTANQNIVEIPYYAAISLATVLFPSISRKLSKNLHDEARELIAKALRFALLILIPSILLISATSGRLLSFLYSVAYHPGASSLSILVIGSGFFTLFIILTTIISSAGSPGKSAILSILGVAISSILCLFLIPSFGLNGAALSTTTAAGIVMCLAGVLVYKRFHVLFDIYSVVKIFVASFAIYLLAKNIPITPLLLPLLYVFLFAVYAGILFLFKELTREDVDLVKSLIPGRNRKILDKPE